MDTIDLDILKHLTTRANHDELAGVITKGLCTKESWTLVGDFGEYYKAHPTTIEINQDFKIWFRVKRHPNWKSEEHQVWNRIIDNVLERGAPDRSSFLTQLATIKTEARLGGLYEDFKNGDIDLATLQQRVSLLESGNQQRVATIQTYDLDSLAQVASASGGYFWRLEDLNKSVGPIKRGDVVIVGKRPEIGGTSFLVSEFTFMLEQMESSNAILFNNEEAPDKVYTRMVSSALNVDYRTLMSAPNKYDVDYRKWLGTNTFDLCHDTNMTVGSIHEQLRQKEYSLIGINVLLKVGGTDKKEDHDKLQALGEELRRIAQKYGPVLAIVQADPTAEGQRYIPQDRIYKSKTALQGEADVLIMIGKDDDVPDNLRYIHVAKNKIPPHVCTDLSSKHIKSEVEFDISTGRFTSLNWQRNSRND